MQSADYLLIVNFTLGLGFAAAFLALSWRYRIALGLWSAAGFVAAACTVAVEGAASLIFYEKLTSFMSFSSLLAALSLICTGIFRHYQPMWPIWPLAIFFVLGAALHPSFIYELPRDSVVHAVSYQAPFAMATALAALAVLWPSVRRRQASDFALALVLAISSVQFLAKSLLAHEITTGPNVQTYILSTYAHFSQTAAAVLSLLLGIVLLVVVTGEMLASTRASLQRDELSGLWNRGAFLERARAALAQRNGGQACVILSDLDRFKAINDRYGHAAGDEVIAAFGVCLQSSVTLGICGRLGGEEFGVFKRDSNPAKARAFVEKVRIALQQSSFALVQDRVTASFGIAFVGPDEPLEFALRRADTALYRAKEGGRDSLRFAEPFWSDTQNGSRSMDGETA